MNVYDLNEILLGDYIGFKERLEKEIVDNIKETTLVFSNTEEFLDKNFLKDELVKIIVEDEEYEITKGNLLTLLVVSRPFYILKRPFPEFLLFDVSDMGEFKDYYTNLLELFNYSNEIKVCLKEIISELAIISGEINYTFGNTVSIKAFMDLAEVNEEFNDLLHYRLPSDESLAFDEIENIVKEKRDKSMDILKSTDNRFQYYIRSGAGVNSKQFGQVITLIGSKPDLFGKIIPYPINTSFLRGLNVLEFFINALGARKALITNFQQVKNSGYLTRKISMLLLDTNLGAIDDCNSHPSNYMPIEVTDKHVLKRLHKRFFYNDNGELEEIDTKDTDKFVGKTILVPSPISCASNEGVCRKCYGKLYDINNDLNIGMIAVLVLTDPLTQRLLSAKHLLETRSDKIEWGEAFDNLFAVNRNLIIPKSNNFTIFIEESDYIEDGDNDDANYFQRFTIKSGSKMIPINSPLKLYFNEDIANTIGEKFNIEGQYEVQINVEDGDSFAYFIMDNNELSKPLREIKDLIETNNIIKDISIQEAVNYFIRLLNEAEISIQSVQIELILREMLKLVNEDGDRKQFEADTFPEYVMYRITDANLKGDSLSRALLFEQIKKQLTALDYGTYDKTKPSVLDKLI